MLSVIIVHAWRLFPFAAVLFLAGLRPRCRRTCSTPRPSTAPAIWRRTYQIILPIIAPIMLIALIFGTVFTFTDMSVVYLLTKGGPSTAPTSWARSPSRSASCRATSRTAR